MSDDPLYQQVVDDVRQLTPEQQLELSGDIVEMLRHPVEAKPKCSIIELGGSGKEIWEWVDDLRDTREFR